MGHHECENQSLACYLTDTNCVACPLGPVRAFAGADYPSLPELKKMQRRHYFPPQLRRGTKRKKKKVTQNTKSFPFLSPSSLHHLLISPQSFSSDPITRHSQWLPLPVPQRSMPSSRTSRLRPPRRSLVLLFTPDSPLPVLSAVPSPTVVSLPSMCMFESPLR
jgi:hypothetical protein